MKSVLLLINPYSRSGAEANSLVRDTLKEMGFACLETEEHRNDDDPNKIILKYQNQISFVVVGGGDGSMNRVLPSLMDTQLPLVVIPLGTANNLARTFDIPTDSKQAVNLISQGEEHLVDVGLVNDIPFFNVAGLGLSTEVNRHVSSELKKKWGVGAFIFTAIRLVTQMNPFRAEITVDGGRPIFTKSWQISVCNGKYYGSGLAIKHDASLNDVKLHLLSTEVEKWWHSVKLLYSFTTGKFKKQQDVTLVSGREMIIKTRRKFAIDVDGDLKTYTPATFKVLPKAVKIIIPKAQS